MLADYICLNLACSTPDSGGKVIQICSLPEATLYGIAVTNIQ